VIFVDESVWPVLAAIRDRLTTVRTIVVMRDGAPSTGGHPTSRADAGRPPEYETLITGARPLAAWPQLAETDAARDVLHVRHHRPPKGVVYTHRALYVHCLAQAMVDSLALSESDVILHIVPMFHANAWCVPFTGTMLGSTQIFGGPNPQPRDICEITQAEKVTFVGAVPTVWIAVKELVEREGYDISSIRSIPIGGSAAPRHLLEHFDKKVGASMVHAWGMTEMSPMGTISRLKSYMRQWPEDQQYAVRAKQGTPRSVWTCASWTTRA
jgi:fatty-acyl-CoA synthase